MRPRLLPGWLAGQNGNMKLHPLRALILVAAFATAPFAGSLLAPTAAIARPAAPYAAADRQEAEDLKVLERAEAETARSGYAGLARNARALQAALDRAPANYSAREVRPDVVIVRNSGELAETLTDLLGEVAAGGSGAPTRSEARRSVYPTIAFLLGSLYIEMRQPERALSVIDKGLKLQPIHAGLINEKAVVLSQQGRNAEALAMIDAALATNAIALLPHRGRLLRARGFQLIELRRLDEAQGAYEDALKAEPNHPGAKAQLEYIATLRDGGETRAPAYTAPASGTAPPR